MPNKRARRHLESAPATPGHASHATTAASSTSSTSIERSLAYGAAAFAGVALLGFVLTFVQLALQESVSWMAVPPFSLVFLVPVVALPIAFLLVVAVIIVSILGKRSNRA